MAFTPKILAFAGSLRADSYNKKLVKVAAEGAREAGAEVTFVDLRDYPLPLYDGDLEVAEGLPENALRLKELMLEHHGLLIASPEYNSSISAVLKNTIDWISRPQPDVPPLAHFKGKIAAIMSASPGGLGGLRGLVTLRSILSNIHVLVLPDQIAVARAHEVFDAEGKLMDPVQDAWAKRLGAGVADVVRKLKTD